jgi:hypothetical protein
MLFPILEPPVPWNFAVVFVGQTIAMNPSVVLAWSQFGPGQQPRAQKIRPLGPVLHVVDDFVAGVMGDPNAF